MNIKIVNNVTTFSIILFSLILTITAFYSPNSYGANDKTKTIIKTPSSIMEKERKLHAASYDVFWKLREKFGYRLRTSGGLIYCGNKTAASKIFPSVTELMIEANKIIDGLDLSQYDINEKSNKKRRVLMRMSVASASIYAFSSDESAQFIEKLIPKFRKQYCKATLSSYNDIKSTLSY